MEGMGLFLTPSILPIFHCSSAAIKPGICIDIMVAGLTHGLATPVFAVPGAPDYP